jgi:hypothetical protein
VSSVCNVVVWKKADGWHLRFWCDTAERTGDGSSLESAAESALAYCGMLNRDRKNEVRAELRRILAGEFGTVELPDLPVRAHWQPPNPDCPECGGCGIVIGQHDFGGAVLRSETIGGEDRHIRLCWCLRRIDP